MKEGEIKKMIGIEAKIKGMIDTMHEDKDSIVE